MIEIEETIHYCENELLEIKLLEAVNLYKKRDFVSLIRKKEEIEDSIKKYEKSPEHDSILISTVKDIVLEEINKIT